ncbi:MULTISPECIES: hypothetical protein [Mycobacteroides]|uniref:Uncharacterized protein n=2 Tax=Mycobacteroides TaxID=670516 RepID=A0A1X0IJD9_9MYCO|nr:MULTISPECIES: hypothetical protein [Mycobacteroides]MDO3312498.1 hypothetical protein [Mycobacteroides abscessus subsp. abscessus]MDO3344820.1 hypothetical protein [Mycobacteroides abscessus subsp. abscessus]ORB47889.1 hypothetical protein BST43_25580 [Mycobacteroides saopaulense]OTR15141.1 hypothetical protein B9M80_18660 [Mycobacteroides abscessus]QOF39517.1 hypothetical protein E3G66_003721 [Mycobacteroides abscessus]
MTGRENVECEAREAGWELKAIGVGDASDDLVRVFRAVPHRSAVLSFSKSGDLFYADGVGINVASITIGAKAAMDQVVAYLRHPA